MESLCADVPLLVWPMIAEQRQNAKFVVEELRMGLRIRASDGTKHGLVKAEDVERLTRELLVKDKGIGRRLRRRLMSLRQPPGKQ
jgi:UDP:flavonoid glycosyltransferase YjiC (YdhE family)